MFRLFNAITTMRQQYMLLIFFLAFCVQSACAQNDTVITKQMADSSIITPVPVIKDTVPKIAPADTSKKRSPAGTAALLSAIFPGAGQVYNKKYWKVPIVYGAIGFPAYLFTYNRKWYNKTKYALSIIANNRYTGTEAADSIARVDPQLRIFVEQKELGSLVNYRNEFRRDMDYAILFTILMWGLNIVDATVDGHLRGFDVSDELTLKVRPTIIPNTMTPGVSVVVSVK
jgi:hypothetical protein